MAMRMILSSGTNGHDQQSTVHYRGACEPRPGPALPSRHVRAIAPGHPILLAKDTRFRLEVSCIPDLVHQPSQSLTPLIRFACLWSH